MTLYTRDRARRSLFHTVTFRAISQIATVLAYVVMVRGMSRRDFGVFNLFYAFIPVVSTIASLGLEQILRRFQPEYLRAGNLAGAAWLVRFISSVRFGSNVALLGILLLAWNFVGPLFKLTPFRVEFSFFCVLMLLHFQMSILQLTLASHMLHRFSVGSISVLSAAKLIAYLVLVHFNALTLESAIFADTFAYALAFAFLSYAHVRFCAPPAGTAGFRPDRAERRRLLRYGLYNNFNDAGALVLSSQSDNFFIAALIDPVAVGAYSFYLRLSDMSSQPLPTRLFDNVIQPVFFAIPAAEADRRIPRDFSVLINMNLILHWPVVAFAVAYHAELVTAVFGGKFVEYSWLLPVMAAFTALNTIASPVGLVAQYEEKTGILLLSKVFGIYNIVAILALVPFMGLYGAAFASGTAQTMKNFFIWWHVRRRAVWTNAAAVLTYGAGIWGGVVALCYGLKALMPGPAIIQLLAGAVLCGLATLVYIRTPAISATDRSLLAGVMKGREARILQRVGLLRTSE